MNLSNLVGGKVPDYIEFAWVTAPNAAAQTITANTVTTLSCTSEVADTGDLVDAPSSNRFTLPAGTYYFEAGVHAVNGYSDYTSMILSLYNQSDTRYVSRAQNTQGLLASPAVSLNGQFAITASKTFELRLLAAAQAGSIEVRGGWPTGGFSNSTAGADQRTTIKLWKLK